MASVKGLWICPTLAIQSSILQTSRAIILEGKAKVQQQSLAHVEKVTTVLFNLCSAFLCTSISWPQFKQDLMSSSHDVRSYHTTQMSQRMPVGSGLWWELLVMRGGTRWARGPPKGKRINYSAWSFASMWLRWQHMRGINLCNIHERTRRCLKATSWVRGAHM